MVGRPTPRVPHGVLGRPEVGGVGGNYGQCSAGPEEAGQSGAGCKLGAPLNWSFISALFNLLHLSEAHRALGSGLGLRNSPMLVTRAQQSLAMMARSGETI